MKTNRFVINQSPEVADFGMYEAKGHRAVGLDDPEMDIIQTIDEEKASPSKLLATKFLSFLENQRLALEELKTLPKEEQARLKKEFWSSIE